MRLVSSVVIGFLAIGLLVAVEPKAVPDMPRVRIADDGKSFVLAGSGAKFTPWGFNYLGQHGKLAEEDWATDWKRIETDFREMRKLGANVVRWHLQFATYLPKAEEPDAAELARLKKLLDLARDVGLYLDLTGLSCYHPKRTPAWFDKLDEADRWNAQAKFWEAIAKTCAGRPAVFCYDLMNEPIINEPKKGEHPWLTGEMDGLFFLQRISNKPAERDSKEIAEAWVKRQVAAIRAHDKETPITVGAIPWNQAFPGAKPLFYSPPVARHLDFVSVHFYPRAGKVDQDLKALDAYRIGKPIVVEETFPLSCSLDELDKFIDGSGDKVQGWISHYFGHTVAEHRAGAKPAGPLVADFLEYWQTKGNKK